MIIEVNESNLKLFESLSSQTRIKLLEYLGKGPRNISELAEFLGVSSTIVTRHISMLESVGLIKTESFPGKRGLQKQCSLQASEITLKFIESYDATEEQYTASIPIGQYISYDVYPTCGLASTEGIIGIVDDSRYFSDPSRYNASLLWFGKGYVEYMIPRYIFQPKPLQYLEISLDTCNKYKEHFS